jgi:glycosyltransferase involved in cell wall biosynthesis
MQPESLENTDINKARFATNFNFLLVGTITSRSLDDDRKNVLRAIKCFCESFENNKKVGLVVKASFGKGTKIDRRLTYDFLQSAIKTFRKGDYPKVTILHGNLTQLEIASLYKNKTIKCLISPTRGEGYGLPLLEAAASGLPIVATGWSGHTDFLSKGLYSDIDYNLKEIPESRVDGRIFIAGAKWAKINENDFKRKIKKIVYKYDNHEKKAHQLKLQVLDTLSKNAVLINYDDFFKKIC